MEKLKAAIVGTGIFGSFHARALSEMPDVELVAICDLNRDRAERVAAQYGVPQVYTSHREMLEKSGCDFVTIATPDHLHAQVAIDTANAGRSFLVEKPFATKREDIYNMRDAIARNGVRAMCDLHNRSSQPYAMAKELIDSGTYGKVYNMYIRLNGQQVCGDRYAQLVCLFFHHVVSGKPQPGFNQLPLRIPTQDSLFPVPQRYFGEVGRQHCGCISDLHRV